MRKRPTSNSVSQNARYIAQLEIELAEAISARVKALQDAKGWSVRELARASRLSSGTVSSVRSARACPRLSVLIALAQAFRLERIEDLYSPESATRQLVRAADEKSKAFEGAKDVGAV
jgi:transcriptional regulator with XRE-family HTH domain